MKIKIVFNIIFMILAASIASGKQKFEQELTTCELNILDSLFNEFSSGLLRLEDFNGLYKTLNIEYCSISKEELKKKMLNLYQRNNFDTSLSDIEEMKSSFLWRVLLTDWDNSVECMVKKEMEYYKKINNSYYFHRILILLQFSENWFQYLEDMYYNMNSIDSGYEMKSSLYNYINQKYIETKDKIISKKLESIYFALLYKEKYLNLICLIDSLLCTCSETYKNSKQRKQFYIDKENAINNNIIKDAPEFYINYSRKVLNYFNKLKKLNDYKPPLTYN